MVHLLKNEIRFCLRKKNILIFLLVLAVLPILYYFPYVTDYKNYASEVVAEMDIAQDNAELSISILRSTIKTMKESTGTDETELAKYETLLNQWQSELNSINYIASVWRNTHYVEHYARLPEENALRDENAKQVVDDDLLGLDYTTMYRQDRQDLDNRFKLRAAYERLGLTQEPNQAVPTGAYCLSQGLGSMSILMGIVLLFVMLLNTDIWTNEFDANAYQLLFTLPISRFKIYATRCAVRFVFTFLTVGIVLGCFYGIGVVMHGDGLDNFVIMNETALKTFGFFDPSAVQLSDTVYPLGTMLMMQMVLVASYLFCFMAIVHFLSILCKNKGLAMMVPSILLMLVYMVLTTSPDSTEFVLNPCGYLLTSEIVNGHMGIGYPLAVVILLVLGVCFYVGGYWIIRKDLQGE